MKKAIAELIGKHVAAGRTSRRLTQEQLADKIGVTRQAIWYIEHGTVPPRWETIYAIARELRCEVWDLIPTLNQVAILTRALERT